MIINWHLKDKTNSTEIWIPLKFVRAYYATLALFLFNIILMGNVHIIYIYIRDILIIVCVMECQTFTYIEMWISYIQYLYADGFSLYRHQLSFTHMAWSPKIWGTIESYDLAMSSLALALSTNGYIKHRVKYGITSGCCNTLCLK